MALNTLARPCLFDGNRRSCYASLKILLTLLRKTKAVQPFHTRWLQVSNRYHFDPGENELSGKLSFLNSPNAQDSHIDYLIEHSQTPQDDDTSDALLTTTSNGHSQGSQNTLREN
ncbi:hypothetical protein GGI16_007935 [Coemansia sp. S142-1]|nr:hypothetical protein GGI16_007935 [Coemansia sp. S142-1]